MLIASRKAEAREETARELSSLGPCEGFGGTVASEAGVVALATEVRRRTGELHILVNNAGVSWGEPFATFPWKAWERVMSVNVAGLFTLTRELMPMLIAAGTPDRPTSVVNLGSVMGAATEAENAYSYSASKAAVHHLTRILAQEFAARSVTVNAIAPGPFPTNMTRSRSATRQGRRAPPKRCRCVASAGPMTSRRPCSISSGGEGPIPLGRSFRSTAGSREPAAVDVEREGLATFGLMAAAAGEKSKIGMNICGRSRVG